MLKKVGGVIWEIESKTIKGQLISKCPISVIVSTKIMANEISALVSKKGWIKKI